METALTALSAAEAIREALRRRAAEFRERLLAGAPLKDIEDEVEAETGKSSSRFSRLASQALPDLAQILRLGREAREQEAEKSILADYRSGMPYDLILEKHHIGGAKLRKIIAKHGRREKGADIGAAKKSANAKRYAKAIGTVVNGLKVLEILPGEKGASRCLVECIDCGRRFTAPAYKTIIKRTETCECTWEETDAGSRFTPRDNLPAAVVESKATLVCIRRAIQNCVISELVHVCCAECSRRKERKCRHSCCIASPASCGYAVKRSFRKGECLEN